MWPPVRWLLRQPVAEVRIGAAALLAAAPAWPVPIAVAWLLARTLDLGPSGVYWAVALSYSLAAVVAIVLFKRGRWKTTVV